MTSFGTEGRRPNGVQIPPSAEVYESITFKGEDIKDLEMIVENSAPPEPPMQQHYMQQHYMQPQYSYMAPQQAYMGYQPPQGYGVPPQYAPPLSAWQQPQQPQQLPPMPPKPPAPMQPPVQEQPRQPPPAQPRKPAWGNPNPPATEGVILPAARNAPPAAGVAKAASTVPLPAKAAPAAPKPKPTSFAAAALNALAPEEVAKLKAQPKVVAPPQRGVPAPRTGGRGGRGGAHAPAPEVPREEFNFEKMLQRFNKEKMMQTAEAKKTINAVQSQPVYNKDDFFDTMSSEATEKQESGNRNRFHEQRRTDAMTFGFDAVTQSHAAQRAATAGRGDGGRGGRGGREGGRGGRGGRDSGRGRGGRR